MAKHELLIPEERIEKSILSIRGQKVILDRDLAGMYDVPTKALKQAVKRNLRRFPADFMLELSATEFANWRSQFVTSNSADKMGLRYRPHRPQLGNGAASDSMNDHHATIKGHNHVTISR